MNTEKFHARLAFTLIALSLGSVACVDFNNSDQAAGVENAILGVPVARLDFATQPPFVTNSGVVLFSQPSVQFLNANGTRDTSASATITLTAFQDPQCTLPASGTLAGFGSVSFSGVTAFTNLKYRGSGQIYLGASASGFAPTCSNAITISPQMRLSANPNGIFTCAVAKAGNVYCWGDNTYGQLGDGTVLSVLNPRLHAVEVLGVGGVGFLSGIQGVAAGDSHSCALSTNGHVFCWGNNSNGQLGNGSNLPNTQSTPSEVVSPSGIGPLTGIVAISAGNLSTCALNSAGNVYCWGENVADELGIGSMALTNGTPTLVVGVGGMGVLSGITALSTNVDPTCALNSAGNVYCWGSNANGESGDGTTGGTSTAPVQVLGVGGLGVLSGVIGVGSGANNVYAYDSHGGIFSWGDNTFGQLGNGTSGPAVASSPVQVVGVGAVGHLSNIVGIAPMNESACAVNSDGEVYCWGGNMPYHGNLGLGGVSSTSTPLQVLGFAGIGNLTGIVAMTGGEDNACALTSEGTIYCWGEGETLGDDSSIDSYTPVKVLNASGGALEGI